MKNRSNELFEIIKSLTPQEKTFFKAYFIKTKEQENVPSFLLLFDAVNELEVYDAHELKRILTKKGFRSNFFKAQTYLTEAILNALTKYHSETENSIKLGNLLQQINILIKKNLLRSAEKYFDRAQKLASLNTMYEYQLLLDHFKFNFHEKNDSWMDKYLLSVREHLKGFELEAELRKAGFDALSLSIDHFDKHIPESELRKRVTRTLNKLNFISKNLTLNNFSKSRFFSAKMQCLMILKQTKMLQETINEYTQYLKTLPSTSAFFAKTVLHGYNSIIIANAHVKNFTAIEKIFISAETFFHSLASKICTPDISSLYYSYILENMMAIFNETGQPEKTLALWEGNKKDIQLFDKKSSVSLYAMNVALSEFMLGNFHRAVRLANTIPFDPIRPTVHSEAKLLLLLAHFELNNLDILPLLARQAKRAYERSNILKDPENIFLNFFEKTASKLDVQSERTKAFVDLKNKLAKHSIRSGQEDPTGSINIHLWLDSKINKSSYLQLIKQKNE